MATNGYSKIDLENLDAEGLWVYETSYDNKSGAGVGAIITKLYPGAKTYTTNVRTNADGTLYRAKEAYQGAEVQMISIPQQNQIIMSENSRVVMLLDYFMSLDEVDDKNVAEKGLFSGGLVEATEATLKRVRQRLQWLQIGKITETGRLSYAIQKIQLGDSEFVPEQSMGLETNLFQNGLRTRLSSVDQSRIVEFLETNHPKGYQGVAKLFVNGEKSPIEVSLGIHTIQTARAAGINVVEDASEALIQKTLKRFN